jgi:hypothetical protein
MVFFLVRIMVVFLRFLVVMTVSMFVFLDAVFVSLCFLMTFCAVRMIGRALFVTVIMRVRVLVVRCESSGCIIFDFFSERSNIGPKHRLLQSAQTA